MMNYTPVLKERRYCLFKKYIASTMMNWEDYRDEFEIRSSPYKGEEGVGCKNASVSICCYKKTLIWQ